MDTTLIVTIIIVAAIGFYIFTRSFRETKGDHSIISLVFLLKEPRRISERIVREKACKALGVVFDIENPDATEFVVTLPVLPNENIRESDVQRYMLKVKQGSFMVNSIAMPYVEDPERFAEQIVDQRLRKAIASHSGWVSVDVMGAPPTGKDKAEAYRVIGKMMAVFADDDCLAIFCPELQRCNEYDDSLVEKLQSDDPLSLFEEPTYAPIVEVDEDDPRMVAAVKEAQDRWPEFVSAFENKVNLQNPFLIKAKFQQDDCSEFMWMSVTGIEKNTIHGVLENTPGKLTNVKEGQTVAVDLSSLNDWLYIKDEEGVGGFTMKAMKEQIESA